MVACAYWFVVTSLPAVSESDHYFDRTARLRVAGHGFEFDVSFNDRLLIIKIYMTVINDPRAEA